MRYGISVTGIAGPTAQVTASDVAQVLITAAAPVAGRSLVGSLITCEDFNIRFCLGGTVPTAVVGHILYAGQSLKLMNPQQVRTFRFINDTVGSNAVLFVTHEYEI